MALLTLKDACISLGGELLLDGVSLTIGKGDRACLVGRNGCGKSTLLKLLAGDIDSRQGEILRAPGLRTAYLPQDVPQSLSGSVRHLVESGDPRHGDTDHWEHEQAAQQVISRLNLNPDVAFETLSGGMKRRVLLARTLVCEPDILLLDEPTNHLDMAAIEWLEGFLIRQNQTTLFVTHDRVFLRRLATRIFNLDRGLLSGWDCDYDTFLQRQQQRLDDETVQWDKKSKLLSKEESWIRQGIKARRTRDEGRVRALEALREEFRRRRLEAGSSRVKLMAAEASGALVIKAEKASFAYASDPPIIRDLDIRIMRGERIGIVGPNGSGKTTLLKLLIGDLQPRSGTVTQGTRLDVAYFDQLRDTLNDEKSLVHNLAGDGDFVEVGGQRRHVHGYLQDFLFTPARARMPVKALSGGERNRLLLAKLFMTPCNLLVMDEPTNDLDMETLDLLEEQLQENAPTLLLVSHDRAFLNNVATRTLALEGNGTVGDYAGGYDDWLAKRPASNSGPARTVSAKNPRSAEIKPRRLGYKEKKEREGIGAKIETLEQEQQRIVAAQCDPAFYRQPAEEIARLQTRAVEAAREIERLFERWAELEALAADGA